MVFNNFITSDKHFICNNTYRKRDTWISELDTCIASLNLLELSVYVPTVVIVSNISTNLNKWHSDEGGVAGRPFCV